MPTKRKIEKLTDIVLPETKKRGASKLDKFISEVAKAEAGKSQVSIGNIRQIMSIVNEKLGGIVYAAIKLRK